MKERWLCGVRKPLVDFYRAAGAKDRRRGECKACNQAEQRKRHLANREMPRARVSGNSTTLNVCASTAGNATRSLRSSVASETLTTAGHTAPRPTRLTRLTRSQNGRCAICGTPATERLASLHLDHDHASGRVRGFLGITCNQGLGRFKEDPSRLLRAAVYLQLGSSECPGSVGIVEQTGQRVRLGWVLRTVLLPLLAAAAASLVASAALELTT